MLRVPMGLWGLESVLTCRHFADHFRLRKWHLLTGPGISDHAVSESAAPRRSPSPQIPEA